MKKAHISDSGMVVVDGGNELEFRINGASFTLGKGDARLLFELETPCEGVLTRSLSIGGAALAVTKTANGITVSIARGFNGECGEVVVDIEEARELREILFGLYSYGHGFSWDEPGAAPATPEEVHA